MQAFSLQEISKGAIDQTLHQLYGASQIEAQRSRYEALCRSFSKHFTEEKSYLFSSPGRTELGGNHTDHNHGKVIAGSIQLDKIAAAVPRSDRKVEILSAGFSDEIRTQLEDLRPAKDEAGKAAALVRGVAAYFQKRGYKFGGFSAYVDSRVAMGSGLSSSASFEVLIAMILNTFYNNGELSALELATAGKYAENEFFQKPCGLMDQLACAHGGILTIDFAHSDIPAMQPIDFDFSSRGYQLMILDSGGDHADLTPEYASIPEEMRCVAQELGVAYLAETDREKLLDRAASIRKSCGDRAFLRALHFFAENRRVDLMREALSYGDINDYLKLVNRSGDSSWTLLQNCIPTGMVKDQSLAYAIGYLSALCPKGVFRVHGGGFAGTVQGYIPSEQFDSMRSDLEGEFGTDSVTPLQIRPQGVIHIEKE